MAITPEELAAFADGELPPARAAELADAVAADPVLAREVAAHRALKARLADYFAPIAAEPVPDRLGAMLRGTQAEVVDFAAAREQREQRRRLPRWSWAVGPALAASLALAVFLPRGGEGGSEYADTRLAAVLDDRLVAEQSPVAETRVLLSFRNGAGDYCRAFSGIEASGIACRDAQGWKLEMRGAGTDADQSDYRMAGAGDAEVMAKAQEMAAGPALDAGAEARAKAAGWR
jgi:hypothetical protein